MKIENVAVISLEDYAEYQELKKEKQLKSIDYDRLKAGSVVILELDELNDLTASTSDLYDSNKKYSLVLINSNIQVNKNGVYRTVSSKYTTLVDYDGNFIHVINFSKKHIHKVIEY